MLSPVKTIEIFQTSPTPQSFTPGEIIFAEGDAGEVMYGILEGEVEIVVNHKVVETIAAGDVFGEGALVHSDRQRASTAIAKIPCKLALMDRQHFLFAVQQTPMFALEVMRSYSDRLRSLKHRI